MGWSSGDFEDRVHEGFLVALVQLDEQWRELSYANQGIVDSRLPVRSRVVSVHVVQVGCDCGWRSPRLLAPLGTDFAPYVVMAPQAFEDECRKLWERHVEEQRSCAFQLARIVDP